MNRHTTIIGAGFSGISAAAYLAKAGHSVDVFEKNATAGGLSLNISLQERERWLRTVVQ